MIPTDRSFWKWGMTIYNDWDLGTRFGIPQIPQPLHGERCQANLWERRGRQNDFSCSMFPTKELSPSQEKFHKKLLFDPQPRDDEKMYYGPRNEMVAVTVTCVTEKNWERDWVQVSKTETFSLWLFPPSIFAEILKIVVWSPSAAYTSTGLDWRKIFPCWYRKLFFADGERISRTDVAWPDTEVADCRSSSKKRGGLKLSSPDNRWNYCYIFVGARPRRWNRSCTYSWEGHSSYYFREQGRSVSCFVC